MANEFDALLMEQATLQGLDGFFSKIKKSIKKVRKAVHKSVKTSLLAPFKATMRTIKNPKGALRYGIQSIKEPLKEANHVRTAVHKATVPKKVRKKINKAGSTVANNKVFRIVATAVATAYGMGLAANAAFAALDAYNYKLVRDIKKSAAKNNLPLEKILTPSELKQVNEYLDFLIPMTVSDQNKIIATLSLPLQRYARKYLATHTTKNIQTRKAKTVENAAYKAGLAIGADSDIQTVIQRLMEQGKTPKQIEQSIKGSQFYQNSYGGIQQAAMQPYYESVIGDDEVGRAIAADAASKQPKSNLLPILSAVAAGAAIVLS